MGIVERLKHFVGGKAANGSAALKKPKNEYMRGNRGVTFGGWRPSLRDAQDDVQISWDDAASRAIDLIQNSGWISGAIDQAVANTVGVGLRLRAMPENSIFGLSNKEAALWAKGVEQRFALWADNKIQFDLQGTKTFGQMQATVLRQWFGTGEVFAQIAYRRRFGSKIGTKIRLVPSHRISRTTDLLKSTVSGVRMDADGLPIAYIVVRKDNFMGDINVEVRARDNYGRNNLVHIFDGETGQVRGITPLVPALQVARQFDQLCDATLTASLIQTLFAATMTSDLPTEETMSGLMTPEEMALAGQQGVTPFDVFCDAQAGWNEGVKIDLGIKGRIANLMPGQKMAFLSPEMPNVSYKDFSLHLLREIARCLGLTYESATGDYSSATYASVRMATGEIFEITKTRRKNIIAPFCQAVYEAWLEEDIQNGDTPFPGGIEAFLANKAAACRAEWRGTPKTQADDLKSAKAHREYKEMGVMSDKQIADDLGYDIEDVYADRQSELAMRQEYGLPEMENKVTGQQQSADANSSEVAQ